jgi:hypothetical protein
VETWFRLPLVVRYVIYAAVGFALALLAFLAWDFDRLYNGYNGSRMVGWLVLAAVVGLLVAPVVYGVDDGFRRNFGSIEQFIAYKRALRTGELPAHIDPDAWRDSLRLSGGANRIARWLAYLVVLFVVVPSLTRQPAYHPVAASLFGLLAVWSLVSSWRKRARITRLAAEVERHAGAQMTPEEADLEVWFRRPPAVRGVEGFALWFSFAFVVANLDRLSHGYNGSLVGLLVWAACVGLVVAVRAAVFPEGRLRRNFGSIEQFIAYKRALRTGELPARIEPDVWRGWLRRSRRANRMEPLWASLFVVFGVLPSLTSQSAYWVTASLFGLLAIRNLDSWWTMRARITRLAAGVERYATRGSTV